MCRCTSRYFNLIDQDRDGRVSVDDLYNFVSYLGDEYIDPNGLVAAIGAVDKDGDEQMSWGEFTSSFCRLMDARLDEEHAAAVPEQVHLSLTTDTSCVVAIWVTFESTNSSVVQIGTAPGEYSSSASGIEYTYNSGVTGWEGFLHKVEICSLAPETYYYYRVGDESLDIWSKEFNFHTAPVPGYLALMFLCGFFKLFVLATRRAPCATFSLAIWVRAAPNSAKRPLSDFNRSYTRVGTFMPFGMFVTEGIAAWHEHTPFDMTLHLGDISCTDRAMLYHVLFSHTCSLLRRRRNRFGSRMAGRLGHLRPPDRGVCGLLPVHDHHGQPRKGACLLSDPSSLSLR